MAWICATLTVVILSSISLLAVRLRPYWVAKYRGTEADLHGASLRGAPLRDADLAGTNFRGADLRGADLRHANLSCTTSFRESVEVTRTGATVEHWVRAFLEGGADLRGANLQRADLQHARLWRADLRNADLRAANLGGVDLVGVWLKGALYDSCTQWPAGFDPRKRGAKLASGAHRSHR
jgi:uncharacterized protein YjbI with pentapeptide repeats